MTNINDPAPSLNRPVKVAISATFTSEPIGDYIKWWGNQFGLDIGVEFAPYNQVFRELSDENGLLSTNTGINILLIRFEDCMRYIQAPCKDKCEKLEKNFSELKELLKRKKKSIPYLAGLFPISTHLSLNPMLVNYLKDINASWKNFLEELTNVYTVDFTQLQKRYDIPGVFDAVTDKQGHLPFTIEFYGAMGTTIARKIWAFYNNSFKVIVLDCDNTLWKGVCGEDGAAGVRVDSPYLELQRFMIQRYKEGFLLALCSKNNEADVWEVFEKNPGMLLKKEHIAAAKINWQPKSENIKSLARELNLGIESFIFLDDNPVECSEVMTHCPEVLTLGLPENPGSIPLFLSHAWAFDKIKVTEEDRRRTSMYLAEKKRNQSKNQALTLNDFLAELQLKISMNIMKSSQVGRVSQLTLRTNQFNLSTIRREENDILSLLKKPGFQCWVLEVSDRFGDYGIVGVVITEEKSQHLFIDTLLLSCRVLGRGVEDAILVGLKKYCQERSISLLAADYYPTKKNKPVLDFLKRRWREEGRESRYTRYILPCQHISPTLEFAKFYYCCTFPKELTVDSTQEENIILDHIAVAVLDIEGARSFFRSMGYHCGEIIHDPLQKVNLVMCHQPGFDSIELVGATDDDSPIKRLLNDNGDVPYHLCYRVGDTSVILKNMEKAGIEYEVVSELKEAKLFNWKKVMFICVKHVGLVELLEDKESMPGLEEKGNSNKSMLRFVVADPGPALLFYKHMGYISTRNINDSHRLEITLEKAGTGGIQLIVPKKQYSVEQEFLEKNGPHPYQVCFYDHWPEKRAANARQANAHYMSYETIDKTTLSLKCRWNVHAMNTENLVHRNQLLPLKNYTAEMLLRLPVYEADDSLIPGDIFQPPEDEVESKLADIWQDLLKVEKIGTNTAFFTTGGNSLNAVILLSKIHKAFDVLLTLEDIFNKPTIRQLAAVIRGAENIVYSSIKPVENKDYYPLSAAQKRLYLLQQMPAEATSYNIHQLISLGMEIDKEKAENIFKKLIKRHESLRMSFETVEGVPLQKIHQHSKVEFKIEYYEIRKTHDWQSKSATSYFRIFTPPGFACSPGLSYDPSPSLLVPSDFIRPFDLSRAPLFRVALLKYENGKSILMVDIHHIITDGTSQEIMLNEFAVLYSGGELPALALQYRDWVEWQNLEEQERLVNKQQEFWLKEFTDKIPRLNLATDYKRPDIQSFEGSCLHFFIQREETQQLKTMALKEDVTLFIMILAIFYLFLSKLSGDEDIVIGTPTAGRRHEDLQAIVGMFVNTLALRNFPKREKKFNCFLKEVRDKTVAAFDNQEYPFDDLVKQVLQERAANRNPLFDVMLVFHSYLLSPAEILGDKFPIKPELYEYEQNTSQNDLHLAVTERDQGLFFSLTYCTKLFEKETIKQYAKNFQELVSIVTKDIEIRLEDINISHDLIKSELEIPQENLEDFAF